MLNIILIADLPFVEELKFKRRPVLQINKPKGKFGTIQVIEISSKLKDDSEFIVEILTSHQDFKQTNLKNNSYLICNKISTISSGQIIEVIGTLPDDLASKAKSIIIQSLNL